MSKALGWLAAGAAAAAIGAYLLLRDAEERPSKASAATPSLGGCANKSSCARRSTPASNPEVPASAINSKEEEEAAQADNTTAKSPMGQAGELSDDTINSIVEDVVLDVTANATAAAAAAEPVASSVSVAAPPTGGGGKEKKNGKGRKPSSAVDPSPPEAAVPCR